jgi:outer membrane protein
MAARPILIVGLLCAVGWPVAGRAQERLALAQAVTAALRANPDVAAARAAAQAAEQQLPQARAGVLPRVDLSYSWQRGNQPVFVFGSLLGQRQFTGADFALEQLNNPAPLSNVRGAFSLEQVVFDGGRTRAAVRGATAARAAANAAERLVRNDLGLAATRAYGRALRAAAARRTADSSVTAAEEDTRTAEARRDSGTGTDADLLSMRVHLAEMRARAIDASSEERIARADLNRLMNTPLDHEWILEEPLIVESPSVDTAAAAAEAIRRRPEVEQAVLHIDLTRALKQSAQSVLLPQIALQGGYEWNDGIRGGPAGAWIAGASLRLNVFAGGASLARVREAGFAIAQAEAEWRRTEEAVRLDALTAVENLGAARARQEIGRAAVLEARESQRMIRDRYDAGIASITDVIRAATAVLEAEAQRIAAVVDVIVGEAVLRRAVGGEEAHQ